MKNVGGIILFFLGCGLVWRGDGAPGGGEVSPAATFCAVHQVTDAGARADLAIAVNEVQKRGAAWRDLYDAWIFMPRFNPSTHTSLQGRSYWFTNDIYNDWSAVFWGTNLMSAALPDLGTNFTLVFYFRAPAAGLDSYGPSAYSGQLLGEAASTHDRSAVLVTGFNNYFGRKLFTASATNWVTANVNDNSFSNCINYMASGGFRVGDNAAAGFMKDVIAISVNGSQYSVWQDGKPGEFGLGPRTKLLINAAMTSPPNRLRIGGGDENWIAEVKGAANLLGGNMVAAAMVFTNSIENDPDILAASYSFCSCLEDADRAVSFQGSSILANSSWAGEVRQPGSGYKPYTNDIAFLFEKMNPHTLVKQEASPGSVLAGYTSEAGGWSNHIPFSPAAILDLPAAKFKIRTVKTDAPRNDAPIPGPINETALQTIITNFKHFYSQYLTNGVGVELIRTPFCLSLSQGLNANLATNNQSWQVICSAITTNFPLSAIWPVDKYLTWEYLQTVSCDHPATHINMTNAPGYLANKAIATLVSGRGWPVDYTGGTNVVVNQSPFFWTNYFPYTVTFNISGGAIQGINKSGLALFTRGMTNATFNMLVRPGQVFILTNTVAPVIWEDSTQPQ